jgi:uncharacterized membrane protein YkoI
MWNMITARHKQVTHLSLAMLALWFISPVGAYAGNDHDTAYLDVCLEQASTIKHTDDFVKVEYLTVTHEGDPSFEIEVRDPQGTEWEFMCEADGGTIYEVEQEVESVNDARFKNYAKVSEEQARGIVTDLYPGMIKEVEYEIESNGDATYEIDVVDDRGTEFKAEVDAASGDIIEVHVEEWQIGEEAGEAVSD